LLEGVAASNPDYFTRQRLQRIDLRTLARCPLTRAAAPKHTQVRALI
jgi:hypothetical protein